MLIYYWYFHYVGWRVIVIFYNTFEDNMEELAIRMRYSYSSGIVFIGLNFGARGISIISSSSCYYFTKIGSPDFSYDNYGLGLTFWIARLDILPVLSNSKTGAGLSNAIFIPPSFALFIEFLMGCWLGTPAASEIIYDVIFNGYVFSIIYLLFLW